MHVLITLPSNQCSLDAAIRYCWGDLQGLLFSRQFPEGSFTHSVTVNLCLSFAKMKSPITALCFHSCLPHCVALAKRNLALPSQRDFNSVWKGQ